MPLFLYDASSPEHEVPLIYDLNHPEHITNTLALLGVEGLDCHPLLKRPPELKKSYATERDVREKLSHENDVRKFLKIKDYEKAGIAQFAVTQLEQGPFEDKAIRIEQRQHAKLSHTPVGTADLGSCVFMAFCQNGQVGGMHVDFNTDPESIKNCLAQIPRGKVGIRLIGGMPVHNIIHYRNLHTILSILNNDANHQFVLLSNDTVDRCKASAVCAYPPDAGYVFTIKNKVPKPKNPHESIAHHYTVETLCYQITKIAGLGKKTKPEKLDPLLNPDHHEVSTRILEPLKLAETPFVGTPLMARQLAQHLPDGLSVEQFISTEREEPLERENRAVTEVALQQIAKACAHVQPEEKDTSHPTESLADISVQTSIYRAKEIIKKEQIVCDNPGNYAVVLEIRIAKEKEDFKLEFTLRTPQYEGKDKEYIDRYIRTLDALSVSSDKEDKSDLRKIVSHKSHAEICSLFEKLEQILKDEPHASATFYKEGLVKLGLLNHLSSSERAYKSGKRI